MARALGCGRERLWRTAGKRCNNAAPSRRGVLAAGTGGFYVTLIIMPFVQLRLAALGSAAWAIEPLAGQPGQFTYRRAVRWWEPWWVFQGGRDFWWFVRGRLFGGEGKSIKSFQYVGELDMQGRPHGRGRWTDTHPFGVRQRRCVARALLTTLSRQPPLPRHARSPHTPAPLPYPKPPRPRRLATSSQRALPAQENLEGVWEHGEPTGPFLACETGSGFLFRSVAIGWCMHNGAGWKKQGCSRDAKGHCWGGDASPCARHRARDLPSTSRSACTHISPRAPHFRVRQPYGLA